MGIKEELQKLAEANEMEYFGVSPAERLTNLPEGHRPTDLLPGAKSVIVLGKKIPQGAITAHKQAFAGERHQYFSYTIYGYLKVNDMLNNAAFRVVRYIEKNYKRVAYPIPSSQPRDEYLYMGAMSNRYAAVCAGLGEFTWSGFVATPKDGPRVRWVSVITDAEIEPDSLYTGSKLCDHTKCNLCVEICPVGALSEDQAVEVQIGDFRTSYSLRQKALCRCATTGLVKGTPGRLQADIPAQMKSMDDWFEMNKKDDPWQRMEFNHGNYCHRCMIECPIGTN
ncbi:hypothetical protein [Paradesulfitobacterium ferrireducens]|uniref:hypothetical protein n=1 Tax=Paradesulfitobacterium ferrireducens TaxID=2816476 RepID=UPI001A8CFDFB|nr:hypothetical protein [Paradesulfitobacterium ferrireducens]